VTAKKKRKKRKWLRTITYEYPLPKVKPLENFILRDGGRGKR